MYKPPCLLHAPRNETPKSSLYTTTRIVRRHVMQLQTDRPPGAFSGTSLGVIEQPQTCRPETKTPPFFYKIYIIKSKGLQINDSFANICRAIIYTNTVHSVARERERHREQTSREKYPYR